MGGRKKVRGTKFKYADYELRKKLQRYLFSYKETLSDDVFKKGKLHFCINEKGVELCYQTPTDQSKMSVFIPYDYSGKRSREEMQFLIQDFILNAYYSYEREPTENHKMKLLRLASILGVNFRTAGAEVLWIENQLYLQAGKLFGVAENLIEDEVITAKKQIPGISKLIQSFIS